MTANTIEGERERCLAARMDDYVPKPGHPATLATAIERWAIRPAAPGDEGRAARGVTAYTPTVAHAS